MEHEEKCQLPQLPKECLEINDAFRDQLYNKNKSHNIKLYVHAIYLQVQEN